MPACRCLGLEFSSVLMRGPSLSGNAPTFFCLGVAVPDEEVSPTSFLAARLRCPFRVGSTTQPQASEGCSQKTSMAVDTQSSIELQARVQDYLNDQIQTVADLDGINALLLRVKEQQQLLQKQVGTSQETAQERLLTSHSSKMPGWRDKRPKR